MALAWLARDAGHRQPGALPDVVVVDLGHGRAEAPLELRLDREELLPLPLERVVVGEVELDREDADVAGPTTSALRARLGLCLGRLAAGSAVAGGPTRSVRSISRVS